MNIVSFGGGTNSTAMIIGMYLHKIDFCPLCGREIEKQEALG